MKHIPAILALVLVGAVSAQDAAKIPLRYQGLAPTARFRLVDVLGSPEMHPTMGHTSAFTPDGKFALFTTGGVLGEDQVEDSVLSLWDVPKGTALKEIPIAKSSISAAALSADAKVAVTNLYAVDPKGKEEFRLVLWDLQAGKEVRTVARPKSLVVCVALSPDGKRILAGSQDGSVQLWDVDSGKELIQLKDKQNQGIAHVLFSADGKQAFTTWGQQIRLWDLSTGKVVRTFGDHASEVFMLAISADGKRLASSAFDQTARAWDIDTGKSLVEIKKDPASGAVISLGLSPDGGRMVLVANGFDAMTGTREESSVSLVDVAAKKEVWTKKARFKGLVPVAVSNKGEALVGGGANPWTTWTPKGELHSNWGGHKTALLSIAHFGKLLYSLGQDGQAKIWEEDSTQPRDDRAHNHFAIDHATALTATAEFVLAAGSDKSLLVLNDRTAKFKRIATTHTAPISCLALAGKRNRAVSGGSDRSVKVFDLEAGKELRSFTGHAEHINAVAFSPDGQWVASASDDNSVRLWPLEKKDAEPIILDDHKRQVTCLAYSPDGKYLVSGSQDQTLKLWDVAKGKVVKTFTGHKNWLSAVLFRGDGQLVSACDDLTVRLWDVKSGKELDKIDLGNVSDCPKCLAVQGDHLYVGTAGWVILKLQLVDGKK